MKMIILAISFILTCIVFGQVVNAQNTPQVPQSLDSLQNTVMKLMKFYDSYDDGSPESLKKAKYNDAADEILGRTATQKEIDDSYKIVDWYIKGDKAIGKDDGNPQPDPEDFDEYIENTDEAKAAIKYLNQQKGMLQRMSYSEFESFALQANPAANKAEIKKAYNALHKTDGKQVSVSNKDKKMTEAQKQMWAIDVLNNPKNYEEARKAMKILKPEITEREMKAAWQKRN